MDIGDTVLHKPTGETWLVACVDGDELAWCGWPEGWAKVADCELKEAATPEYRLGLLHQLASMQGHDSRKTHALRRLSELEEVLPSRY